MNEYPNRAAILRQSVHPSITVDQISDLVDIFYGKVLEQKRLGGIFKNNVEGPWAEHLEKMKSFWRSVLLRTGEYKGKPVPAHQKIDDVRISDFGVWLALFAEVCDEVFEKEAAKLVKEAAERIASSLWLSRHPDPFAKPPDWSVIRCADGELKQDASC